MHLMTIIVREAGVLFRSLVIICDLFQGKVRVFEGGILLLVMGEVFIKLSFHPLQHLFTPTIASYSNSICLLVRFDYYLRIKENWKEYCCQSFIKKNERLKK